MRYRDQLGHWNKTLDISNFENASSSVETDNITLNGLISFHIFLEFPPSFLSTCPINRKYWAVLRICSKHKSYEWISFVYRFKFIRRNGSHFIGRYESFLFMADIKVNPLAISTHNRTLNYLTSPERFKFHLIQKLLHI